MSRRLRLRVATTHCVACRATLTVQLPPLVYLRLVKDRPESDTLWSSDCVCGAELVITVGDARRAA